MTKTEIIAAALTRVKAQAEGADGHIIQSNKITRADRELLSVTGWLQEIMRGWYMLVRPDVATGDSAAWYANFWDFIRVYLEHRFGNDYCLSVESSLELLIENPLIPKQVIAVVKKGAGVQQLLHSTSIMTYTDEKNFPKEIIKTNGIQVVPLAYALCKVSPTYFRKNPREAEIALRLVQVPGDISRVIAQYSLKSAASRIIGAYKFLGNSDFAEQINSDLRSVGIRVSPSNPFEQPQPLLTSIRIKSPYAARIKAMWAQARSGVVKNFPDAPGLPKEPMKYLQHLDEIYQYDAYNSLSIEGYSVSTELIDRVKNKQWNPDKNPEDINDKNALAARGYYECFMQVKSCITSILSGDSPAEIVERSLQTWYRYLFGPSVQAGIIPESALFGYRNDRVYIRNSCHTPPPKEAVVDAMEAFFECLHQEDHPGVNAILGHYFFVYIHPYMDGNGRIGRFLMNTLLAAGGYPWTVVRVKNRARYISTLEDSHTNFDLKDFTQFITEEMYAEGP